MPGTILEKRFFDCPSPEVAKDLLGKLLVVGRNGSKRTLVITEVEAYEGPEDKASHAHRGRTARTEPMFGGPGIWYIYLVYGMYWMCNVVTGKRDHPAAILIRGGILCSPDGTATHIDGPGKLTKALGIDRSINGKQAGKQAGVWFEDGGIAIDRKRIVARPRVGVGYAAEWKNIQYNFSILPEDILTR